MTRTESKTSILLTDRLTRLYVIDTLNNDLSVVSYTPELLRSNNSFTYKLHELNDKL